MSKVPIQVENTSYAPCESICFFPISSCFARGKKHPWTLRFQEGIAISFFFFKTIGQILFLDAAWI